MLSNYPALNSFTKFQYDIFKFFDESELSDEGRCKILALLQELFGFLLIKFKNAVLPTAHVLPPQPALPLAAPDDYMREGPPAAVVEADKKTFLPLKVTTQRKAMLPLPLSHLH